jgi:hypothetical protein
MSSVVSTAFDELAAQTNDPFRYPICYLKPKA